MTRVFRSALAFAGIVAVVAGVTLGASHSGQMNDMNDLRPYTPEALEAAQQEGKTTLLFFHAPWCPVCKAQEPKVKAHLNRDHKTVVAFKVDYDSNAALRKALKVEKQSTLILYRGTTEVARLSYKSDDESIAQFFGHAAAMPSGAR